MIKNKHTLHVLTICLVSICVFSCILFVFTSYCIVQEFIKAIGAGAMDSASLLAKHISLSNKDVERLTNMEYCNIALDSKNKELQALVEDIDFAYAFECVYVFRKLEPNEIKYSVSKENKNFFKTNIGTPLSIMWLLDVPISPDKKINYEDYFAKDIERYTYLKEEFITLLGEIKPSFSYTKDEYGRVISGYAPIWSVEGDFIGYLGLDMRINTYRSYRNKTIILMSILFFCTTITLSILFSNIYIKHMKNSQEKIYKDPLTNTYNRRYYDECFQNRMSINDEWYSFMSIMMIDVDDFKKINDKYGHKKGDECLYKITEVLTQNALEILIRYGGDEFIGGCFIRNKQQLDKMLHKIIQEVNSLKIFNDEKKINLSIGVCMIHKKNFNEKDFKKLIVKADENLYIAKKNGKNQFYLTEYTDDI